MSDDFGVVHAGTGGAPKRTRAVVAAAAVAGGALSLWLLVVVVQHAGQAVYDLPVTAVAVGVVAAVGALAGWALVARSGDGLVLGSALLGLLLVAGVVALLSVGILLLLAGGAVAVVLGRVAGRRRAEGRPVAVRTALAAAVLVGLGVPVAAVVAADGPVVRCLENGVAGSSSLFRRGDGSSSSTGSSMSAADGGGSAGVITSGGRVYRYRCVGDELVEFEAGDA